MSRSVSIMYELLERLIIRLRRCVSARLETAPGQSCKLDGLPLLSRAAESVLCELGSCANWRCCQL